MRGHYATTQNLSLVVINRVNATWMDTAELEFEPDHLGLTLASRPELRFDASL